MQVMLGTKHVDHMHPRCVFGWKPDASLAIGGLTRGGGQVFPARPRTFSKIEGVSCRKPLPESHRTFIISRHAPIHPQRTEP